MGTPFDLLEDAVSQACDDLYGEDFELRPMRALPNVRAVTDTTRVAVPFRAIFDERGFHSETPNNGQVDFKRISTGRDDAKPMISVDEAQLARIARRPHDHVVRLKTGALYELGNPVPDGMGRAVFHLRHIQAAAT